MLTCHSSQRQHVNDEVLTSNLRFSMAYSKKQDTLWGVTNLGPNPILTVWPWEGYWTSMGLHFLPCNVRIIIHTSMQFFFFFFKVEVITNLLFTQWLMTQIKWWYKVSVERLATIHRWIQTFQLHYRQVMVGS